MADNSSKKSFFDHPSDFSGSLHTCLNHTGNLFDDLSYSYTPGTNRLIKVNDSAPFDGTHDDIEDQTASTNYTYDASGNMIGDAAEGLTIAWNYLGKVDKVTKANNNEILFRYDGMGQRVVKIDRPAQGSHETQTIYVRDASGNVMAVYEYIVQKPDAVFDPNAFMEYTLEELHIFGSSRIGLLLRDKLLDSSGMLYRSMPATLGEYNHWIAGNKRYELTNHLGNVLSVVSDRKIGHSQFNTLYFSYYTPDIRSATDYYPFGWAMPGSQVTGEYRYGFGGHEKVDELKGSGNHYTAQYWEMEPRIGRRWNTDPIVKSHESPYAILANNPIWFVDPNGADTSFADNAARTQFTETYQDVDKAINDFDMAIDSKLTKWQDKGYDKKSVNRRMTRKIRKLNTNRSQLLEIKSSFDEVINSETMFHYSARSNPDNMYVAGGGTNYNIDQERVDIWFYSGVIGTLVHETRHGEGYIIGEWGWDKSTNLPTNYDYQDEYEAFRMESNYSRLRLQGMGRTKIGIMNFITQNYGNKDFIFKEFHQYCEPETP